MAGEYFLAMRADGFRGSGEAYDPYDASSPSLFNSLMLKFATDNPQGQVCIHIGPGIFQVPAYQSAVGGWRPKARWRIVGAGRRATILKVVGASATYPDVQAAIGNDRWYEYAEGFTLEDLTIDCNMRGHKDIGCTLGAVRPGGSRTKVRRVRVLDFGTERDSECFPVYMAGADFGVPEPRNCEISDCIIEQPSPNNVRETTILTFGSGEDSATGIMSHHRSCVIRKNRVDCDYSVDQRQIKAITYVGTSATARTFQPHNRKIGDWVIVSGALVIDSLNNPFNGSFQVTSVPSAHEFSYTMPAVPSNEPTGTMWLGRFPCQAIGISGISQQGTASPWIITVTTAKPHFRIPGQNVRIENVTKNSIPGEPSPINGPQRIIDVPSPTTFRFAFATDPASDWIIGGFIGVSLQGIGIDGGTGALAERNRIFGAVIGGPYHDTWHTKDIIVQKNYYYANHSPLYQNMGGFSGRGQDGLPTRPATSLIREGADFKTAKLTCGFHHGLSAGQVVRVSGAVVLGNPTNPFNGDFLVEAVPTPKSFTYRMIAAPLDDAQTSPAPVFGAVWQTGRIIYTGNIVEPITNPLGTGAPPTGFAVSSNTLFSPYYVFRQVIVARNRIRNIDGGSDPLSVGMYIYSTESSIIHKNTIGGISDVPIRHFDVGAIKHLHNTNFSGEPFQSFLFSTIPSGAYLNQLETEVDLATVFSTSKG